MGQRGGRRGTPVRRAECAGAGRGSRRPAVGVPPDQPTEALAQLQRGARQGVVAEPIAAGSLDGLAARLVQRVAGRRERKLVDHEERQRLARHVDALPEGRRRDQHRIDLVAEPLEEALARGLTLGEHVVGHAPAHAFAIDAERPVARCQPSARPSERASTKRSRPRRGVNRAPRSGIRAEGRGAPARESRTASRRSSRGRVRAQPAPDEASILARRQRGRDEDRSRTVLP
jgi:hypothetical protein